MFARKLRALQYPDPAADIATDDTMLHDLVIWLEDRKIRHYPIESRDALRTQSSEWHLALAKYLRDLECCHDLTDFKNPDQRIAVVDWLLAEAVGLEYADDAARYTSIGTKIASAPLRGLKDDDPAVVAIVDKLATTLQLPQTGSVTDKLQAILRVCTEKLSPKAVAAFNASGTSMAEDTSLAKFPDDLRTGGQSAADTLIPVHCP
eukprot:SAG22_NODE_460_length_10218_cov_5.663109_7_plen_206_part_00